MYSLTTVLIAAIAGGLVIGGTVWVLMTVGQLRAQVDELQKRASQPTPAAMREWAANRDLDHRAQLLAVATLVKLSARDQLDALQRISPEMVREVVEDIAPQLVTKEVK